MKYYEDFQITGQSFGERVGPPDEFDSAMGRIALGFSFLEDTAANMIIMLADAELKFSRIITAELSFKQKINMLASLVKQVLPTFMSADDLVATEEQTKELFAMCWRSEHLRNTYLHSSYTRTERAKVTAKSRHGLRIAIEAVDSGLLLDVADFIVDTGMQLEGLPLLLGIADQTSGGADFVSYSLNGSVIKTFRFGQSS